MGQIFFRWGCAVIITVMIFPARSFAEQAGSIRGTVYDQDFDVPLASAKVTILETGDKVVATDEGHFLFGEVPPGKYTLIFSKDGYTRQVKPNLVVSPGQMTDADASLTGEFLEMEEFIVQDLQIAGTEAGLLMLRVESPSLLDSISSELLSQAGVGDAAGALKLVAGATVQDGKYAVVRGLPDRYVNSQMNRVRLPTADADKRAVQLDQFPSGVIESVQVSKTFTPDQQGDASGGAVNVVLKGIPDEPVLKFKGGVSYNTQVTGRDDFLSYEGGGIDFLGKDDGSRDIQYDHLGQNWDGAVGVSRTDAPDNYSASFSAGGKKDLLYDVRVGGFANVYYKRMSSFYDNGINDAYEVRTPGEGLVPDTTQGVPSGSDPEDSDFYTQLFDVTEGAQEEQWGALGTVGIETDNHALTALFMYTHVAEDKATLAEDTRGKEYFFPGYDPDDPYGIGNANRETAPYLRTETLQFTERTTETLQFKGEHKLPVPEFGMENKFMVLPPEIDWTIAMSSSILNQPDKRQFGERWLSPYDVPAYPLYGIPASISPALHYPYKDAATFTLGNLQRVWKEISEDSDQYFMDVKFPFEQWSGDEGYLKLGLFHDKVSRTYNQDSFSNFGQKGSNYEGGWEDYWSDVFADEDHPITAGNIDVDYEGGQEISAWYYMFDFPLTSFLKGIGGVRYEQTNISIVNFPESEVMWVPIGTTTPVILEPGDADVAFEQSDILPSVGLVYSPQEKVTFRVSRSETVARQTFKELTPIQQREYQGADIFVGNPQLKMSALVNYDLRLDYKPYDGGLLSFSWFKKDIKDPIEYVQKKEPFKYTTAVNYPQGELAGYEVEARQDLGHFWDSLHGLSVGGNATYIYKAQVTLPEDEAVEFEDVAIQAPMETRDMSNAPEYLYNLFLSYNIEKYGLDLGVFYTVRGDTLVAGAGYASGFYTPNVYEKEYGTLNVSVTKKLGKNFELTFQAKNLTNPEIQEVYRSDVLDGDTVKTSHTNGIDYSLSISGKW